ncbi:ThiF family adenylyltransferase [Modestobacter sp. VKM Ac-2986]|uniref:ThiF family adenylyltransferase n=1 Tax=Modestobacter sp. VKM Ac-2986 TaxID=3004140 RepID=UPI0022ABA52E|nr:ThiF family adenylyltransferase [Modestobacter sp. VKM Ac-2986]MCZ2829649.1 ThiF family adenylyltransferase [Modestobacter sp. VKM Ac-2986]
MTESPHPLLPAATPVLRLDDDLVQVGGVDGRAGLRLHPAGTEVAALLRGLDGRRSERAVRSESVAAGFPVEVVEDLLAGLRGAGLLHDLAAADLLATDPGPAATARAGLELPAAVPRAGAAGRWRSRRQSAVVVDGATRVGTPLAAVLAASGVGRVHVRDRGPTLAGDAVVGGATASDEGRPRALAAADAVRRVSPLTDLRPLPPGHTPDLVVLCRPWAAADPLSAALQHAGTPHLVATVRGETGVVGPLVLPGTTSSCLRCADARRRDDDPAWPRLAAQLAGADPGPSGATVTCLLTALTAAVQVLALLDGDDEPATVGATLELRPPDLLPRVRRWPPHPDCDCGAAGRPAASGG